MSRIKILALLLATGVMMITGCSGGNDNPAESATALENPDVDLGTEKYPKYKVEYGSKFDTREGNEIVISNESGYTSTIPLYETMELGIMDYAQLDNFVKNVKKCEDYNKVDGLRYTSWLQYINELSTNRIKDPAGNTEAAKEPDKKAHVSRLWQWYEETVNDVKSEKVEKADVMCITFALYEHFPEDYSPIKLSLYGLDEDEYKEYITETELYDLWNSDASKEWELIGTRQITETGKLYIDTNSVVGDKEYKMIVCVMETEKPLDDMTCYICGYGYDYIEDDSTLFMKWADDNEERVWR